MEEMLPKMTAALSLLLMGACGVLLLIRLTRVLQGKETVDAPTNQGENPTVRALLLAAGAALLMHLLIWLAGYGMARAFGDCTDSFAQSFEALWTHWDVRHYTSIAREGYTNVGDERLRLVFFPLYPLLMHLFSIWTGASVFLSGMMISLLCSMGASALVYDLACLHAGHKKAVLATGYFLLSPMSLFLCCVYTEALFLCLTLAFVSLTRRGHPWLAALCGMLSAFTRMPGVIAAGIPLIALLGQMKKRRLMLHAVLSCIGQMLIVFLGLFAYWGINAVVTGDPMSYMTYQRENWFQQPGTFWESVANTTYYFVSGVGESDWLYTWGFQLLCMFYVFGLLLRGQKRLPFDLTAYSFVYICVVLSPTWLLSGARYLYGLCTLPLLQAMGSDRIAKHGIALALSVLLLIVFIFGYVVAVAVF